MLAAGCASPLERGARALDEGDLDEADRQAARAALEAETRTQAHELWAAVSVARASTAESRARAIELHERALALSPGDPQALSGLGVLLLSEARHDELLVLLADAEGCDSCAALRAAAHLGRGRIALAEGRTRAGLADLEAACALVPDTRSWLELAEARLGGASPDVHGAIDAVRRAHGELDHRDALGRARHDRVRRGVALAAARAGGEAVEQALALPTALEEAETDELAFAFEVHRRQFAYGDRDAGRRGAMAIYEQHEGTFDPPIRSSMAAALGHMFAVSVTDALANGDGTRARALLREAAPVAPGDEVLALQALLVLGLEDPTEALTRLEGRPVPGNEQSRARQRQAQVSLEVMAAHLALQHGDARSALDHLVRARSLDPDSPEYRVGWAEWLSRAPVSALSPAQRRALDGRLAVDGDDGYPRRFGEALAHLHHAEQSLAGSGEPRLLGAPSLETRRAHLSAELGAAYPYRVEYHPEPHALVRLANGGHEPIELEVECPRRARSVTIPAGGQVLVRLDRTGFTAVRGARVDEVLLTEPHMKIHLEL